MLFCGEVGGGDMLKYVWCFPFTFLICRFVTIKYKKKSAHLTWLLPIMNTKVLGM